jgi:hypothetical protein
MKKYLFSLLLMAVPMVMSAQVNVDVNGKVSIGPNQPLPNIDLSVGGNTYDSNYRHSIASRLVPAQNSLTNTGLCSMAAAYTNMGSGRSMGVCGLAGRYTSGYNYGILGGISESTYGAGVFGTISNHNGIYVNGLYAGYFDGPTYCNNTITANSYVTLSDIRLKQDIKQLSTTTAVGSTLENVLDMNVITYQYKDREIPEAERDTISAEMAQKMYSTPKNLHYGLSAQELQKIYPDLVYEGQDGYLGVNYVELVPILIRSIQELKQELDAVKGAAYDTRSANGTTELLSPSRNTSSLPPSTIYDMQGRRLSAKPGKGVYVQGNKKRIGM